MNNDPFYEFFTLHIGNGTQTKLWRDIWCDELPLRASFPNLFAMAANKEALVSDYLSFLEEHLSWSPVFNRNYNDWELGRLKTFFKKLYEVSIPTQNMEHAIGSWGRMVISP